MMGTTAYRKAYEEAKGNKEAYLEATNDFAERHQATARILWCQFEREKDSQNLTADFKAYLNGLEKQDLVALLIDLMDDVDGLSVMQMRNILQRSGVEGYQ